MPRRPVDLRGAPPFARAQVRYTRQREKFVDPLRRILTRSDAAALSARAGDTVKEIVKRRRRRDDGPMDLKGLRSLAIDEI